ncbi:hypothetical protein CEXT_149161 [Caerostris extrusa]|uniref:Uncharacterized protein n=1 Tax=Caerostris extrusa TaxID=172846 RepID=A0AAV4TVY6_CAEEX|nr:hypothetical protein CEXT_149161 [Caerostris extrusa]
MERKIKELQNQKKGPGRAGKSLWSCPIKLCMYHHNSKKSKLIDDNQYQFPAKRHTATKQYVAQEERHANNLPVNSNRYSQLNNEEILNENNTAPITPRIPTIMEKIVNPTCINCNLTGHTAAWRQCPKYPKARTPPQNPLNPNNIIRPQTNVNYAQVTQNFSYASALSTNIAPIQTNVNPTINPNLIQQSPFFNNDELHKTLYILKEIVNLFTSTTSIDSVFTKLSEAKAPEDKFFVLLNGLAKSNPNQNQP